MSKQEKRAKTLIEFMGLKDPDLYLPDHDTWCMKLYNNPKLIRMIFAKKYDFLPKQVLSDIYFEKHGINHEYFLDQPYQYDGHGRGVIKDVKCKLHYTVYNEKVELEHVITKHGSNGWSQRLGFLDVFYSTEVNSHYEFEIEGIKKTINAFSNRYKYNLFFEIKTKKQTIGSIAREVEYYRSALNEIHRGEKITPIVISPEKIPIDQFDSFSFEDILELEKEVNH